VATGEGPVEVTKLEWWYGDIEEFVKKLWGIKWEGGAAMGFPAQDTYRDIDVTGGWQGEGLDSEGVEREALWMDEEFDLDEARALIEKVKNEGMPREEYANPGVELILNLLAHDGHIPTGDYRVTVYW
jgi:hypothetical protein